jgi:K+-transporting ATPase ATPase A chain
MVTELLELLAIFSIGAGLFYMFGKMVGDTRQGWVLWAASAIIFLLGIAVALPAEQAGNPLLTKLGVNQAVTATQSGGNMEGKEVRYGITVSAIQEVTTTATSTGTVMSFHDSYTPIGGLVLITNMALGEIIFGGVGAGLYSMLMFAIIAVFIAGLMVGRTPEYLGKKIERKEIMMAVLALLVSPLIVLGFSALAIALPQGMAGLTTGAGNMGPHGLSDILYAFTSTNANNGSAFAGLNGNSPFYNWTLGFAMLIGRFAQVIPLLALGGAMVKKKVVPTGLGTFPTTKPLFVGLLIGVILIVGALTYFPAYSLGPIVEHLLMQAGRTF